MKRMTIFLLGLGFFALSIAFVANGCAPAPSAPSCVAGATTRTEGCDEFKKINATVYKNNSAFTGTGWHPLVAGDKISTNSSGQAELNFADCYPGHIYCFRDSDGIFQVENCNKASYSKVPRSGLCATLGAWYVSDCKQEFSILSGSITVKAGSTFVLVYLPERQELRELSLVIVLAGEVFVEPVDRLDPTELGEGQPIAGGEFYFTMPLENLQPIAGLEPRQRYSVAEVLPLVEALDLWDWMSDTQAQAQMDGVLPGNWPVELGGSGETGQEQIPPTNPPVDGNFVVEGGGGALADLRVLEALFTAVDWNVVAADGGVSAILGDHAIDARTELAFDLARSRALFEEAGYLPDQLAVVLLFPEEDELLGEKAAMVAEYLSAAGVKIALQATPGYDLITVQQTRIGAGESVLLLRR
jgi:hypothetical protein